MAKKVVLLALLVYVFGYEVPEVLIEVYEPKGFSASIPDLPGIGLFSFNGNLNSDLTSPDVGDFSGEVLQAVNGRWTYTIENVQIKKGDVLNYWIMVSVNRLGYLKDNLRFVYTGSPSESQPVPKTPSLPSRENLPTRPQAQCVPSVTTVLGKNVCSGEVIFQDEFNVKSNSWQFEHHIPSGHPDYPFMSYQNVESVIKVENGKLNITPTLLQTLPPYSVNDVRAGTLDLFRLCTEAAESCYLKASGSDILPPVVSGRANTKYAFTFKYGQVDIRAKLVRGDWLYPDLLLEPFMSKYGREHFSSGVIMVGCARGNQELRSERAQIGNTQLLGGVIVDRFQCHDKLLYGKFGQPWSDDYHTYSVRWTPEYLKWSVDGAEYGRLTASSGLSQQLHGCESMSSVFQRWSQGTPIAPFDEEFYLALGVSAGGITMFPDRTVSSLGQNKPWTNLGSKAKLTFWQDYQTWYSTWSAQSSLLVDSISVTAI